jgi:hypothetical protein
LKDLLVVAGVTAAALVLVGASVGLGHDTTILVSPQEAVAEQFVRKLAARRYDVAMAHLEQRGPAVLERVRSTGNALRGRAGAINQVEGEPGAMSGDTAVASAVVTTERAGKIRMTFELVRRAGVWRISNWRDGPEA